MKSNTDSDLPIIPPPASMTVNDSKIILYTANEKPITRKIGFK